MAHRREPSSTGGLLLPPITDQEVQSQVRLRSRYRIREDDQPITRQPLAKSTTTAAATAASNPVQIARRIGGIQQHY
jgi:hypothetical protein